jgi:flagellin
MKMISINTNYGALFASKAARSAQTTMDQSMERLSTGKRINYAADDAAGQGIATRMTGEIQGLAMAARNASDGQSLIDTAEGALQEVHTLLLRMRELSVQAANSTTSAADRTALNTEVTALETEITRIGDNTTWGGIKILNSTANAFIFQVGADKGENISVTIKDIDAAHLSLAGGVDTVTNAGKNLSLVDQAISLVSTRRGELGAISNRLSSTVANLDQIRVNLSSSRGRIQDADFAKESSNLARTQIMQQAATAMIAQANASKGTVLTLIQS